VLVALIASVVSCDRRQFVPGWACKWDGPGCTCTRNTSNEKLAADEHGACEDDPAFGKRYTQCLATPDPKGKLVRCECTSGDGFLRSMGDVSVKQCPPL